MEKFIVFRSKEDEAGRSTNYNHKGYLIKTFNRIFLATNYNSESVIKMKCKYLNFQIEHFPISLSVAELFA